MNIQRQQHLFTPVAFRSQAQNESQQVVDLSPEGKTRHIQEILMNTLYNTMMQDQFGDISHPTIRPENLPRYSAIYANLMQGAIIPGNRPQLPSSPATV